MSELSKLANRIRLNIKRSGVYYVEAGRDLIKAKAMLPHGQWLKWLSDNFDMDPKTAQNYMQRAEDVDAVQAKLDVKYETVSHLPAKKLRALAVADKDVLKSVPLDADQPIIDQLVEAVRPSNKAASHKIAATASLDGYMKSATKAALAAVALLEKQLLPGDFAKFKKLFDTAGPYAFNVALFMPNKSEVA
jgi:hypothetical protein